MLNSVARAVFVRYMRLLIVCFFEHEESALTFLISCLHLLLRSLWSNFRVPNAFIWLYLVVSI